MDNDNLDKLIELREKQVELLKEYKQSINYWDCLYDVVEDYMRITRFFLFDVQTKEEVRYGTAEYLRAWLWRRRIPDEKVYNYHLIRKLN